MPDRTTFESLYSTGAPWDVGKPQQTFVDVADQIGGSVLDAGCGTGDMALFLASRGNRVTGMDYLEEPIRRAKLKAAERGQSATFLVKDAMTLKDWGERFDSVVDSGLFHCFTDEDRKTYVAGLANVVKPGGRVFLMCFSDAEPGTDGPRRISERELRDAFSQGWDIESLKPSRFETRPDLKDFTFSPGGPKTWFAIIRRM
jgi:cyclopropane fatty-acyl-phospholipid synthase-like methyltransferase